MFKVVQKYSDNEIMEINFSNFYMANCYIEKLISCFAAHHDKKRNLYRIVYFNENIAELKTVKIIKI